MDDGRSFLSQSVRAEHSDVGRAHLFGAIRGRIRVALPAVTKQFLKRAFPTVFFRHPRTTLEPERLYAFLDAVWKQRDVEGSVVEVGCYLGGTAALASRMMENLGIPKRYVVIDTFTGFVPEHFERDVDQGVSEERREDFRADEQTVRRLLRFWGAADVEVVRADVATLDENKLPESIALALVDVDLEIPTYEGLRRVMSRLSPGGLVLVDDCNEGSEWTGAKRGYQRFVRDYGLPETYSFGMGLARPHEVDLQQDLVTARRTALGGAGHRSPGQRTSGQTTNVTQPTETRTGAVPQSRAVEPSDATGV